MKFSKKYWKRAVKKQGIFGGKIKSREEVEELNDKIVAYEKKEGAKADEDLEKAFEAMEEEKEGGEKK